MCSLRDAGADLRAAKIAAYGVSLDDVATLKKFAEQEKLDLPLLSDTDASVAAKYDAMHESGRFTGRVTYLIDPEGILRHIDTQVDVKVHGQALIDRVKSLSK